MTHDDDQKMFRTFEEFEREALRREGYLDSGYEVIDEMFAGELDFDASPSRGAKAADDADDEE